MDPITLAALLNLGGSVLGAVGASKPKETTTTSTSDSTTSSSSGGVSESRTNFGQLRADAEAAGFNPLTALRLTGGAGNVTTVSTNWGQSSTQGTTVNKSVTPGASGAAVLGSVMGAGADYLNATDPMKLQRDQLEVDLMQAELGRMQQPALGSGNSGRTSGLDDYRDPSSRLGAPSVYTDSGYTSFGFRLIPSPLSSDGQVHEDRNGEGGGTLSSLPNWFFDVGNTIGIHMTNASYDRAMTRAVEDQYYSEPYGFSPDKNRPYYAN